jgi:hypothetical protein
MEIRDNIFPLLRYGRAVDRYNIVSESDLASATERLQAHLRLQPIVPKIQLLAESRKGR